MTISRCIKASIAAVAVAPALIFAPTAVADDARSSSLPTGSITGPESSLAGSFGGNDFGKIITVIPALLDAGISIDDIVTLVTGLHEFGASPSDIIDILIHAAGDEDILDMMLEFINDGTLDEINN